jgi:hypothetical protein
VVVRFIFLLGMLMASAAPLQAAKVPFTVADDVALSHFGSPDEDPFVFSPDHRFLAVYAERGRLDLHRPESVLRIYMAEDVTHLLKERQSRTELAPLWEIRESMYRHGPIVTRVRWLRNSGGVAFLAKTASGNNQLLLADLGTKVIHPLTDEDQDVTSFDINTQHNFVYTALTRSPTKLAPGHAQSAIIGNGKDLSDLMFPDDSRNRGSSDRSELWAVVSGRRFKLQDPTSGRTLTLYHPEALALSPDGQSLLTVLPVEVVPAEWEKLYPQAGLPLGSSKVRAGRQDLADPHGVGFVEEYDLIDLRSGEIQRLTDSPTAASAAWWALLSEDWSADGRRVALSGVFLPGESRPCVAVIEIGSRRATCVESVPGAAEDDGIKWRVITRGRFAHDSDTRLTIDSALPGDQMRSTTYRQGSNGHWKEDSSGTDERRQQPFGVSIKQSLNDPPALLATDNSTRGSRIIWDPNPLLRNVALGEVSVFRWKDRSGHDDVGGLFKPPGFVAGRRYPLVIQTHGFAEDQFIPSGAFPTAFAAQELAALGILVLQVREACPINTPEEAPCAVSTYEAAANELVKAGIADPDKLGMIGFSRTCYYVLEELTAGTLHFKAAAITDGVDYGYFQYLLSLDLEQNSVAGEADTIIGAPPFGGGLTQWLKRSPGFRMDRVETPLQVVALNTHLSLMGMWEPYATLRYLRKPVDLIIIPDSEHVMTNPGERMISQGGTVDWFRFWLKDEEDPDPAKSEQYARWHKLRELQTENASKASGK